MNYKEFIDNFTNNIVPKKPKYIRMGQSLMVAINAVNPELYKEISDKSDYAGHFTITGYDCFHKDEVMPKTLKYIKVNWHKYDEDQF